MSELVTSNIPLELLGQSGVRFQLGESVVLVDPYLTDRVAEVYGANLKRMVPAPTAPHDVTDADWVLVTHEHLDHCDPTTLVPIAGASPNVQFMCPNDLRDHLVQIGIDHSRIVIARETWRDLSDTTRVRSVPAAHPEVERDADGLLKCVGYLFEHDGRRIYHAGDTSPHAEIFEALNPFLPIQAALLPVNEQNYYRERQDIIGNMTVREAFQMATDLEVDTLVPIHWDLFAPNSVFADELELLYEKLAPPFHMALTPRAV